MEIIRIRFLCFLVYCLNQEIVLAYSCDYAECSCLDDMITCVDVKAPHFKFKATASMLYMDIVQIINLTDIIKKLPNLKYLTLMNMQYFNCKWLKDLPKHIYLRTNMCSRNSTTTQIETEEFLTAPDSLSERYEKLSTEIYKNSTTVFPILIYSFFKRKFHILLKK